ncbi:inter-alpha-trypsin inhibitor heavy chain H3 isoform X2 [Anabrus simplex]|uniref:inter-alpha-trypsin inhibitor heavy chain H3 isoform X2 n=1 Tax=Anabrus simplex TaxID=316456 RepID=UPI0035A3904F
MAGCNRLGVLVFLVTVIVFVQQVDKTFARHTFVVVPEEVHSEGVRHRRASEDNSNDQGSKPQVKSLRIESIINYRYAYPMVYSDIVNPANVSREVTFTADLPDDAFVSGFAITIKGVVYKAYVKEKEEAKRIYQDAVSQGRTAGHVALSARDSNTFTVSVNVEAFGKVKFNFTYEELLTRELGTYKHKISVNPGQIVDDMSIQVIIQESSNITTLQVPDLRESNELLAEDNSENRLVSKEFSNGHTAIIRWAPTPDEQREINSNGVKGLFEVRYDIDRTSQPNQILVNEGYFVHFFAPPNLNPLNKHVIFVLDRSGSMYGHKIRQLKEAMSSILDELRPGDSFSIVLFSDTITLWTSDGNVVDADNHGEPLNPLVIAAATPENIQAAKTTVNAIESGGGTHIYDALQTALRVVQLGHSSPSNDLASQPTKEPMIIFLTDGQPNGPNSDAASIINGTTSSNQNPAAVIYGLAFGDDADFNLLKKVSLKNSGFARKIYQASDASLQLKNFYKEVSSPLLSDVTFHYLENQVDVNSLTKVHFRTHNNGSEIVVAGRLVNSTDVTANVTGFSVSGNISLEAYPSLEVTDYYPRQQVMQNGSQAAFMERLWAYLTIRQLLDLREQMDNNETVKEQALELALKYAFVTPLTSLVVVKPNDTDSATDLQASSPLSGSFTPQSIVAHRRPQQAVHMAMYGMDDMALGRIAPGIMMPSRKQPPQPAPNPHAAAILPLTAYSWFPALSIDTNVTLLTNGVQETFRIGYNETNTAHDQCVSSLTTAEAHCRHLPHCALPEFSEDINVYLQNFCRIDSFIGVCCPDSPIINISTTETPTTA